MLRHWKVKIFSDNQHACSIIYKDTKPSLNFIAIDIFLLSLLMIMKIIGFALQLTGSDDHRYSPFLQL